MINVLKSATIRQIAVMKPNKKQQLKKAGSIGWAISNSALPKTTSFNLMVDYFSITI